MLKFTLLSITYMLVKLFTEECSDSNQETSLPCSSYLTVLSMILVWFLWLRLPPFFLNISENSEKQYYQTRKYQEGSEFYIIEESFVVSEFLESLKYQQSLRYQHLRLMLVSLVQVCFWNTKILRLLCIVRESSISSNLHWVYR